MVRRILLALFLSGSAFSAFPQSGEDSTFLASTISNTINRYKKAIGVQARLYNGSQYKPPLHTIEEHPYFRSDDWITGNVFYDGEYFRNVPLMLDLYSQQLITEHLSSGHAIQLVIEKLQHFTIADHHFEKIDSEAIGLPEKGFYEILYPGETKVIARRKKFKREKIESSGIERTYEERNRLYIFKGGLFSPVKTKGSVLKLLGDQKQNLKKFIRTLPRPFSTYRERNLKDLAEYYDSLLK
jgi:hypothetical protein